ncbi:MBL fold metallo-hydrolase [Pseudomonas fluorescens]|uniref:MBL fold metallo-hydrolase n=1 Tax=Pseudomonas fluorescens TaxID=294 RepID=UPI00177C6313|nr:MBL fold metallo-hydrolase [Pseudomonas fluorescens]MBD8149503.1 MBL fold metallo-hydrolase [Pseudomonas fluorescens]MBD8176533.1 MBL fold metallo-hydrolase [Pseudomonas fluorescens]MBD8745392.1 MBL fold metallo-hydrolase [Pseudomonas fluorescens]MBD8749178.1 MBL fold metallo-hydrolase [Pseudomonas fluorescens]MBD8758185.1 MBL fold metallo-hydrolase [Pseudomonas fluorescens]
MKFTTLPLALGIACGTAAVPAFAGSSTPEAAHKVDLQQVRNATVKITYGGTTFLIDPMLAKKGTYPGFENTYRSELRNPLVDLTESPAEVISGVDAVIVTHTHLDHWDDAAQQALPKDIPLFAQHEEDAQLIRSQGFKNVRVLTDEAQFGGVKITKTGGQHGTDEMYAVPALAKPLGEAMGVVFQAPGYKTLYLAGDTVWRKEVDQAIETFQPEVIVLNAGKAMMAGYKGSIIMGEEDVLRAAQTAKNAKIVAVHMDAINHMSLTREALRSYVKQHGIEGRVDIPEDGASLAF